MSKKAHKTKGHSKGPKSHRRVLQHVVKPRRHLRKFLEKMKETDV